MNQSNVGPQNGILLRNQNMGRISWNLCCISEWDSDDSTTWIMLNLIGVMLDFRVTWGYQESLKTIVFFGKIKSEEPVYFTPRFLAYPMFCLITEILSTFKMYYFYSTLGIA